MNKFEVHFGDQINLVFERRKLFKRNQEGDEPIGKLNMDVLLMLLL